MMTSPSTQIGELRIGPPVRNVQLTSGRRCGSEPVNDPSRRAPRNLTTSDVGRMLDESCVGVAHVKVDVQMRSAKSAAIAGLRDVRLSIPREYAQSRRWRARTSPTH